MPNILRQQCPISHDNSAQYPTTTVPNVPRQQCPMSHDNSAQCPTTTVPNVLRQQYPVSCLVCCPFTQNTPFRHLPELLPVISSFLGSLSPCSMARHHFVLMLVFTREDTKRENLVLGD